VSDAGRDRLELDGLGVSYLRSGPARGPPVVLLHGGGFDAAAVSWKHVLPGLAADRRVYALDFPGYGQSDPVPDGVEVTVDYYAGVLGDALDALGIERAVLVGISLGGGVALGYALERPERVEQLVAIDAYGLGGEVPGGRLAALLFGSRLGSRLSWGLIRRSRRLCAASIRGTVAADDPEELVADALAHLDRPDATEAWARFQRAEITGDGARTEFTDRLGGLAVPALFVHGREDSLVPFEWAERAAGLVPEGRLEALDCGHWSTRERPAEIVEHVRAFLG
jgi:pimeloyl-ACP methyl ester carboxylesterase